MKRLSPLDASWLSMETQAAPMHVGCLAIFKLPEQAPEDFVQQIYQRFRSSTKLAAPFNSKLSSTLNPAPAWVADDEIDIDYHVRLAALPRPGGEKELMVLASRLHGNLLDRNRPLWECTLIEGLTDDRLAIYIKMHHSMADGVAAMKLIQSSFSEDPDVFSGPAWEPRTKTQPARKKKRKNDNEGGIDILEVIVREVLTQFKTLPGLGRTFGQIGRIALNSEQVDGTIPFQAPRSELNTRISGQRVLVVQPFDLNRIKTLCKQTKCTINDIVMALCAGCLRRYLQEYGELPEKPLIGNVPVSVRPEGSEGGNAISVILCNLATEVSDPIERLQIIHNSMNSGKKQLMSMSRAEITNYTILVNLPFIVSQIFRTAWRTKPMYNLVISNVPGPKKPLYLNGARMEALYPASLIFNGQALNITITSYVDSLDFSFTACRRSLPKVTQLPRLMCDEMDALEAAIT